MTGLILAIIVIIFVINIKKIKYKEKEFKHGLPLSKRIYDESSYKKASNISFYDLKNDRGYSGEYLIFKVLEKTAGFRRIFVNAYIPIDKTDDTTEIDLILVHDSGIYVIESKNYNGWIFGDENNKNWMQTFGKG